MTYKIKPRENIDKLMELMIKDEPVNVHYLNKLYLGAEIELEFEKLSSTSTGRRPTNQELIDDKKFLLGIEDKDYSLPDNEELC